MNGQHPTLGQDYSYHAVANLYRPRPVGIHFVLTNGISIVALRVREGFNPKITSANPEIWVGATPLQRRWGFVLAGTKRDLPLFVKRTGKTEYTYLGRYQVTGSTTDEARLAVALAKVSHDYGLTRIVCLKKA